MSKRNAEIVREAMDAYNRGDKDRWARFMDPDLETVPVPEFPEPGPLIGPDAAWDFYQRFGETLAGSELFETAGFETADVIDAGDRVLACQRTPLQGRGNVDEVEFSLWGVHTFDQGRWMRTQWFFDRGEALAAAGLSD
jgi:ketosteroid isomerase-like protein